MENKYTVVSISGIHTTIGKTMDTYNYTQSLLQMFLPNDNEIENWSDEKYDAWLKQNNEMMIDICRFLNERDKQLK